MAEINVELRGVTKRFGDIVAVDNVSLQIGEGEFFSLLGPSGCGKTTTLRMIAGFELPTEGEIYLKNQEVSDLPPFKRNVNTVFQDYALFPHMTVGQNISFGLETKKMPKAEIKKRVDQAWMVANDRWNVIANCACVSDNLSRMALTSTARIISIFRGRPPIQIRI